MRVFLIACLGVALIGGAAYAVLEGFMRQSAADRYSAPNSVRLDPIARPNPDGTLAFPDHPAGGVTSGRTPGPGVAAPPANPS